MPANHHIPVWISPYVLYTQLINIYWIWLS